MAAAIFFPVAVVVVFLLFPRSPSLGSFSPASIARSETAAWQAAHTKKSLRLLWENYKIFSCEYGCYPLASARMSIEAMHAVDVFRVAPDFVDQERALAPLTRFFDLLTTQTRATFDPRAAAQMELQIWTLRASSLRQQELCTALSEQMAMLFGKAPADCLPAAKKKAQAMRAADRAQWAEAAALNAEAWTKLKSAGN